MSNPPIRTGNKSRLNKARSKGHNFIQTAVGWLFLPVTWLFSICSAILKHLLESGYVIFGSFLMLASAYVCTENYFLFFGRKSLFSGILNIFNFWTFLTIAIALLLFGLVEFIQGKGLEAAQSAKANKDIVGATHDRSAIALGVAATVLEGLSLIYGMWQRGGLTLWTLVLSAIGLFGFKIGLNWIGKGEK